MGADKQLTINATGYPATNDTWRTVQGAMDDIFEAVAGLAGKQTILTGVRVVAPSVIYSGGYVAYDSEVLPFISGAYNEWVTIIEENTTAEYDNDSNNDGVNDVLPVIKNRYMRFGTGGIITFPFANLQRLKTILELSQFALPDNIINIKPNWNAAAGAANEILNKPINLLTVLARGRVYIGDVGGTGSYTISFPNVGTTEYMPVITFMSGSAGTAGSTHDLTYATHSYNTTSFVLQLRQMGNSVQDLYVNYFLIPRF
ncbi:hypothetical protein Q765_00165 [Flavobacterium rivuli WB 3.3-2 = DSM 21788]|uniref:Uncharacterized protein n=1 Tax=Flavobacterium rivuli WB 3.3-2 = DSM 21788 TaxID=1121895 RepID=A0A0A2M9Q5_9FLAO|nr:hypothetical protein [Flavobacterium rivuli]KGO88371.1 hypothetical protein Q765_00165 [Flavobacterium rivuli WB 3.3-2 = DSM 21788]